VLDAKGARFSAFLSRAGASFTALFVFVITCTRPATAAEPSAHPSPAAATTAPLHDDAEQLFQRARTLHDQKKWTEAEALYRQAWEQQRTFKIAANLALVELKLEKPRDAAEHLDFALRNLPADDPKIVEARAHLERMLAEASKQVGTATVHVEESGAKLLVDGEPAGTTPLDAPLFLTPGPHALRIEKAGFQSATTNLTVTAGESYDVPLKLAPAQPSAPPPVPVQPHPAPISSEASSSSSLRTAVLIGEAALTLTATGFGIAYAIQSSNHNEQAQHVSDGLSSAYPGDLSVCSPSSQVRPPECSELESSRERATELGQMATAAFITAGALAATTVATYFLWPANHHSEHGHLGSRPHVAVSIRPDLRGVGLAGAF
jgi:tetratricopeptide (TPR) repeat protein